MSPKEAEMNEIIVKPGKRNYTPEIVEILRGCPDGTTVSFEKGVYDFYTEGVYERYLCPVCNQSGDKKIVFYFSDKHSIVLDGNGSVFVFHGRVFPFAAINCKNITLKNFTVTFSFMRYITADARVDDKGITIKTGDPSVKANCEGNLVIEAGGEVFSTAEKYFFVQQGHTVCFLGAGKRFYEPVGLPAGFMETFAKNEGENIYLGYLKQNTVTPFTDGAIVISYDEDRQNDNIFFEKCKDVKVENVKVFRGAGMGIVSQLCENVEIAGVAFQAGENGDEVYSTTADGLFFTNCTGKVYIHDCNIKNTMDDAVSIHGVYAEVDGIYSPNKLHVKFVHKSHSGYNPYYKGDKLIITDGKTHSEKGFITVKSSRMGNDVYSLTIETEENISDELKIGDYIENHYRSPEVVIENNFFDGFPSIRLASAKRIAFVGNVVQNGNSVMINDLLKYWYTYGKSEDVLIRGNKLVFMNTGIKIVVDRNEGSEVYHGDIEISKNVIMKCGVGIFARNVSRLTLDSNAVAYTNGQEDVKDCKEFIKISKKQLLMRRDRSTFMHTPLPDGYSLFKFHRGGDERMSEEEYIRGWFDVCPKWTRPEFDHFYYDDRIPEDGYFLILDKDKNIVGHSNVQLNEHKAGTATVHFVEVKETEKGKRLGYVATEQVLDYVDSHAIQTTYLTTDEFRIPAIKIYLKLGFRPVMWDADMRERWFPILKELGYNEIYDEDEKLVKVDL